MSLPYIKTDFWERFNEWSDATYRSVIVVRGDGSLRLADYKVYINRNIHRTPYRFEEFSPPNSVYDRFAAGTHTVVVREFNVKTANRLESNKLEFELRDEQKITILATLRNGCILLRFADTV